ncbi:hypothetical protein [Metabacillus malikii]|uniref:Uncharacterized protein n=1 Tax=Metabacillus malikii TaxID=1504265 RepID=A0ABT9ZJH0_9BACI|nr:hypothetical protein [Metabacillus malikii]MDQ0232437.1 hypothetical protein [Metabacillus malikii]
MFLERIDEQLLEEIKDALYEEHDEIVATWDGEYINLESVDFEDTLRSEIFSDYLNIPLRMLKDLIFHQFPFIKEKEIDIDPYSEVIISENEAKLKGTADVSDSYKNRLSETERQQLDNLHKELTQLYHDLEIDTSINITHLPKGDVPEEYYENDDSDYDFVQIEFIS